MGKPSSFFPNPEALWEQEGEQSQRRRKRREEEDAVGSYATVQANIDLLSRVSGRSVGCLRHSDGKVLQTCSKAALTGCCVDLQIHTSVQLRRLVLST